MSHCQEKNVRKKENDRKEEGKTSKWGVKCHTLGFSGHILEGLQIRLAFGLKMFSVRNDTLPDIR